MNSTKHTLVALVQDKPGVLSRISSLFRRRSFNIESVAVGPCEECGLSRLTVVTDGTPAAVEQVRKQLAKVIDVVKVADITQDNMVYRELAMIKVKTDASTRAEIIQLVDIFRANIIDVASDSVVIEVTGDEDKIDSLFNLLKVFGIKEMARTGRIAMLRGGAGSPATEEDAREPRH